MNEKLKDILSLINKFKEHILAVFLMVLIFFIAVWIFTDDVEKAALSALLFPVGIIGAMGAYYDLLFVGGTFLLFVSQFRGIWSLLPIVAVNVIIFGIWLGFEWFPMLMAVLVAYVFWIIMKEQP